MNWRDYQILQWLTLIFLGATAASILPALARAGQPWWWPAGMLVGLAVLWVNWPERRYDLYLITAIALVFGLMLFSDSFAFLAWVICAHATVLYPNRRGMVYVLGIGVGISLLAVWGVDRVEGLAGALLYGLGAFFFGFTSYTRMRTEASHRQTQKLLEELQAAHQQLREYAEKVEELAVSEERNRLARELHDTMGHRLTVAAVQLEGARRLIPSEPERAAGMVATVREQVVEALAELRRTVATLRTPLEADLPLPAALTRLVEEFRAGTGLEVHLALPGDLPRLPDEARTALYRGAQEALTNVQRHASARQVWLEITCRDGSLVLNAADDGVGLAGLNSVDLQLAGFGLRGLRERAAHLGGSLSIAERPEGGTLLRLSLPLREDSDHA